MYVRSSVGPELEAISVLHVLEATLGGTRRYVSDIVDANVGLKMGLAYSVERADVQFPELLVRARVHGWATYEVPMVRSIKPVTDISCLLALRRAMVAFKPDVVHAHSSKAGALSRIVARTLKKRPSVVYSPHSIASGLGVAYRFIENGLATVTERFIAVSKSERSQLLALGLAPQSQIDVVHPVVDGRYFEPKSEAAAKAALGLTGATVLLGIGRLSDQKNPFDFFEIAARVRAAVPGTKALWVGDGELRGALEKRIAAENASSWFEILGWRADVRSYIAAADLVISASRYESFGYATVEALAMERPVIASNVLGTRDIMLDDLSKMMYAPKDTRAAVELCISALRLRQHTAEIVRKGRIALLKRYSSDALRLDLTRSYQLAAEPHL